MHRHDSNRPVPAAIDGRKWSVAPAPGDLAGATDTRGAKLFAPVTDTPTGRMVRNHELAHARITPAMAAGTLCKRHGVTMEALQWSEDSRISTFLDNHDLVDRDALTDDESMSIARLCASSERSIAGAMLVNFDLPAQRERIEAALESCGVPRDDLSAIYERVDTMREAAARGARGPRRAGRRRPWSKIYAAREGFRLFTIPLAKRFDMEFPPAGADGEVKRRDPADRATDRKVKAVKGRGAWADLRDIHRPRLDRTVRPRRAPCRRFSDSGVIPSAVHRLPTDGAIFAAKRRSKGGTVLCDASGSMSYSDSDIERLLQEAPGSTVAFYSGSNGGGAPHGRIVIGADRGRAATVADVMSALPGNENLIDGPALRWLARQPAPRFWITDEGVGGVNDFGVGGPCHAECIAICRAANIKIVPRVESLRR